MKHTSPLLPLIAVIACLSLSSCSKETPPTAASPTNEPAARYEETWAPRQITPTSAVPEEEPTRAKQEEQPQQANSNGAPREATSSSLPSSPVIWPTVTPHKIAEELNVISATPNVADVDDQFHLGTRAFVDLTDTVTGQKVTITYTFAGMLSTDDTEKFIGRRGIFVSKEYGAVVITEGRSEWTPVTLEEDMPASWEAAFAVATPEQAIVLHWKRNSHDSTSAANLKGASELGPDEFALIGAILRLSWVPDSSIDMIIADFAKKTGSSTDSVLEMPRKVRERLRALKSPPPQAATP